MCKPLLILLLFMVACSDIYASDNYPAGARSIGLSNAFISISDPWSTFHNQATLASFQSYSAGVFYESRFSIEELSLAAVTAIAPTGSGTFGFSFYQFGKDTYKAHRIAICYARRLTKRINTAIQLDYFSERYPENDGSFGFATFECGLTYQASKQLTFGAHAFNPIENGFILPRGKQKIAAVYRIGGHYQFSDLVLLTAEVQKNTAHSTILKTGLEFLPLPNLALRFGVSGKPVQYTTGMGYSLGKITCDIAFSYHGNLGFTPSFSVQYKL